MLSLGVPEARALYNPTQASRSVGSPPADYPGVPEARALYNPTQASRSVGLPSRPYQRASGTRSHSRCPFCRFYFLLWTQ
ncbi:MAG: hypothetical protein K5864_09970 [Bacteroidales bacterium]|nr:hypothetical protein [Bacteroidales bacterium]